MSNLTMVPHQGPWMEPGSRPVEIFISHDGEKFATFASNSIIGIAYINSEIYRPMGRAPRVREAVDQ